MFNEEWELLTEPLLMNTLPVLSLSGISLQSDEYSAKRDEFWKQFETTFVQRDARETVFELVDRIKTPPAEEPNLRNPEVFATKFEELNRDMELKYTKSTMDGFYDLLDDIDTLIQRQTGQSLLDTFTWSTKVLELENLIQKIQNPLSQQMMLERFIKLVAKARIMPNDRAHSVGVIRNMVSRIAEDLVDNETKLREELGMVAIEQFRVPSEDETEEQRAEYIKQIKLAQQEQLKKLKKKPKTDEEEAKEMEELNSKVSEVMMNYMIKEEPERVEKEISIVRTKWLMDHHITMDETMFDTLNRKVSVLDIDLAEQEVILRADLDVPMQPFVPMPPIEEEFRAFFEAQAEATKESQKSKKKKKNKKQLEEEAEQLALLEQARKLRSEPWK